MPDKKKELSDRELKRASGAGYVIKSTQSAGSLSSGEGETTTSGKIVCPKGREGGEEPSSDIGEQLVP
jgi:hypothetical protein